MRPPALTDRIGSGPLEGRRAEVLALLRGADAPLGVQEVATRSGLHRNTARFHLDGLVDDGLVERAPEVRDRPGRPRVLYRARPESMPGVRSFQLLAEMLTAFVSEAVPDASAAAVRAGEQWGRHLTEKVPPYQRLSAAEAVERLRVMLADVGFDPAVAGADERPVVRLRHCPFREVAERHRGVVCALHLGLMRGALAEMRAPVRAADLQPFVEPSLCLGRLEVLEGH